MKGSAWPGIENAVLSIGRFRSANDREFQGSGRRCNAVALERLAPRNQCAQTRWVDLCLVETGIHPPGRVSAERVALALLARAQRPDQRIESASRHPSAQCPAAYCFARWSGTDRALHAPVLPESGPASAIGCCRVVAAMTSAEGRQRLRGQLSPPCVSFEPRRPVLAVSNAKRAKVRSNFEPICRAAVFVYSRSIQGIECDGSC